VPDPFVLVFVPGVTPGKWVGVWKDRMASIPLEAVPASSEGALTALHDATADVALVRLPVPEAGLALIPLYSERAVVVVAKDHVLEAFETVTLLELVDENILAGQDAGTVELVAAGLGVAVMPQSVARALSRRDVVARIVTDAPETRIALAWLDGNPDPLIQEFVGIVRGRTANSSRGEQAAAPEKAPAKATARPARKKALPPKTRHRRR
jgi:DNA-binding transcriptional LysR family regulator